MPMDAAREFTLDFDKIEEQDMGEENGTCSAAFLLAQDKKVFRGARGGVQRPLKDMLLPAGDHRMILDWAVGRSTCHQASIHNLATRYCNNMSRCIDAPSGAGHLCKCHAGYDGNPYVADGCVDINECGAPGGNNCTLRYFCHNTQGNYTCSCPNGWIGDGYKTGTSCKEAISPSGVGLALVVTISSTALCYYWAMKRRKMRRKRAELFRKNGGLLLQQRFTSITSQGTDSSAKIFSAEELKTATNNYNETRILGRGAYGTVYKGVLPDETVVAVKKSRHIHNRSGPRPLTREDALRIAAETAEALAYLHSTAAIPIIHRDIKSSNILLDENFVAKISDFGASRSVPFDQTHVTTLIQGTIGYLDPEYFQSSQLTEKSDVYSFGVVLAELLTRQKPISVGRPEESCNLAMHVVILVNEGRLLKEIEPHILEEAGEEQLYAVAQLSVRCLNMNGQERPIMKEVASVLEELRRSFTNDKEQTMRRKDEPVQKYNEQGHLLCEASSTSSLHYSEGSTQLSMEAEMKASCHTPR
uniref:Wall-associated receptor kinase 5 n=1 Tax=Aegilops tauschii subsp. strangulata TaxID=200361 RepID=A0A453CVL6_AEGTS